MPFSQNSLQRKIIQIHICKLNLEMSDSIYINIYIQIFKIFLTLVKYAILSLFIFNYLCNPIFKTRQFNRKCKINNERE